VCSPTSAYGFGQRALWLRQQHQFLENRCRHGRGEAIKLRAGHKPAVCGTDDARVLQSLKRSPDYRDVEPRIAQPLARHWVRMCPRGFGRYLSFRARDSNGKQQHECEHGPVIAAEDSDTLIG
jgi:hypothetical protein